MSKHFRIFLVFSLIFFLIKIFNLSPRVSDENFYFYTAHLITKGLLPYRDFFFQHFPSQILLQAFLMKIFGFRLSFLKLIHLFATLGSGFLLYRLLAEKQREEAGLIASAFFLFSFVVLGTTDFALGVHEATFFLLLSWYLLQGSAILAGLALFVGLTFRLYILPAALGFLVIEFYKRNFRKVVNFLISTCLPFIIINLSFYALFGEKFLIPVWKYHFLKFNLSLTVDEFPLFIRNDVVLIVFALASLWLLLQNFFSDFRKKHLAGRKSKELEQLGMASAIAVILQFVFLKSLSRVFQFYFLTLIPFLSVLASLALTDFLPARSRKYVLPLVIALSLVNGFFYQKEMAGIARLDNLNEIVLNLESITDKNDTIFGSYVVAPLLGLMAEREITDYQVDTNFQRNLTGLFPSDQATRVATKSAVFIHKAMVDYETGEILALEPFYVNRDVIFEVCKLYRDYRVEGGYKFNAILLWDCLPDR